jgi:hypothetical protein
MDNKNLFYENVTERIGEHVVASTIRPATEEDVSKAKSLHVDGKCPHTIVKDMSGWPYDFRSCAICGKGLGTV